MQSLTRNTYSRQDVLDALTNSRRTWDFGYELLDATNLHKQWLEEVVEGAVKHSAIEQVRRSASFRMKDTDVIAWSSDRIRPWAKLQMPDGGWASWPQGVFLITSPVKSIGDSGVVYRDVEGLDQTVVLRDNATANRYAMTKGTNYATAIRELLVSAGIPRINVEPTDLTASTDRDWDPGTSHLEIVNDLLKAINYEPIAFSSEGVAIARSYQTADARPAEFAYTDDDHSVTLVSMTQSEDFDSVPNQWTLVVSDPSRSLTGQWTNDNPNSPTSVTSRGRVISVFDDSVDAPDQPTLDAMVQRRAFEDSQASLEVDFTTGLMPFHDNEDVLLMVLSALGVPGKYREVMWDLQLAAGQTMTHRVQRIVNVDPTNTVPQDPVNP